jgi:4Fe-4S binding domain
MQRRNHKVTTNAIIIIVLLLVDRGDSAFQVPFRHVVPRQRPHAAFYLRSTTLLGVGKNAIRMPAENQISSDTTMLEGPHEHPPVVLAGKSPQAIRLRKALQEVWNSAKTSAPIILVGPPGSGKAELVDELLDRLPFWQKQVVHRLSMADAVNHHMDTMLGMKDHQQPGLLDLLADQTNATLVLTSFSSLMGSTCTSAEELERRQELYTTMAQLITDKTFYSRYDDKVKTFAPRIVVTCSQMPDFVNNNNNNNNKDRSNNRENDFFVVKVPALESRTQDMHAIASAKIKVLEKNYGLQNVKLSVEANHRLLDHKWDVDTAAYSELDQELGSALALLAYEEKKDKASTTASNNNILQPRHMLVNAYNERMRHRLLYEYPALRKNVIASPWVFDHTLRYIVTPVFILTLLALFLGPQTRDHNTALTIFWAGWWPLVMLSFPLLGRIWCSVCPFMAVGTLAQEAVTGTGSFAGISSRSGFVELQKWPKWGSTLGAPFAFGLFFAILMWEELWNLPQNGTLSAMLLLLITSGAVFNSVQYEKRFWCRYLCPIGAMCRVFGTMSMLEVRSWKANCEGCTDAQCFKGNSPAAKSSDEFAIKGCTIALKNNQLRDMGDVSKKTLCKRLVWRALRHLDSHHVLSVPSCFFSALCACLVSRTANEKYPSSTRDRLG